MSAFREKTRNVLRNKSIRKKLDFINAAILGSVVFAIVISVISIFVININFDKFYSEEYLNTELQFEIRLDIQMMEKDVLWAITSDDAAGKRKCIEQATHYANVAQKNVDLLLETFHNKALAQKLKDTFAELSALRDEMMGYAAMGNRDGDALKLFNGDYGTKSEELQQVLIEIGEYCEKTAKEEYTASNLLGTIVEIAIIVMTIIAITISRYLGKIATETITEPIEELKNASNMLKNGELNVDITYDETDELGDLARDFKESCNTMNIVISDAGYVLGEMAKGDFTVHSKIPEKYVGDFRKLLDSVNTMNRQLDDTLKNMDDSSEQVTAVSGQLAESAQAMAEGATDQASAVEELTATIAEVANISAESAKNANDAAARATTSANEANTRREDMNQLTEAMEQITITSKQIESIIGAIEDIASQTNLLSLNASIEAARAGEAGRGFAVVADQIGKLAADSADQAITTRELISKALDEIGRGNEILDKTKVAFGDVIASMESFADMASGSAEASQVQAEMLKQIEGGINQISEVVESNSAAAQETSAISEELSARAILLKEMIGKFKLI